MTAVQLLAYDGKPESLTVATVPVPSAGPGEVLIRVFASPINPSDLHFLRGEYAFKKPLPAIPGFEGSGTVVASGSGVVARWLRGKRVAFAVADAKTKSGAWSAYVVAPAMRCIPLRKGVDLEQAACMIVNPLMAVALMQEARRGGHRAIVQTAAASALGKMVIRLARRYSIPAINIVRRPEQVDTLRQMGAEHVLDSSASDFDASLRRVCRELDATICFDAVGGVLTGRVLDAQPKGGRMIMYGSLFEGPVQLHPASLIFEDKRVGGMYLTRWLINKHPLNQLRIGSEVQSMLGNDLKTDIQARYPLEDPARAVAQYASAMSAGKVLFVPSPPAQVG